MMAICRNANTYRQITIFIQTNFKLLSRYFKLEWKAAPHYTTIRNHIKGVDTEEPEGIFRAFTQDLLPKEAFVQKEGYSHIAVDGKVLRGSEDAAEGHRAIQSFGFFDTCRKLILGQIQIAEKTNEIPVFQQLLAELQIQDSIFTADALHTQKKTFELAAECGHKLLIQVKGNQQQLAEVSGRSLSWNSPMRCLKHRWSKAMVALSARKPVSITSAYQIIYLMSSGLSTSKPSSRWKETGRLRIQLREPGSVQMKRPSM